MITVLIADDHGAIRTGLRMILENTDDIQVVAEAADGHAALQNAYALKPDVILMDLQMPNLDGIAATRELAAQGMNVLVLTTYDHDDYVFGAVRAGAAGFLLKTAETAEIINAVQRVAAGQGAIVPEVSRRIFAAVAGSDAASTETDEAVGTAAGLDELTDRELHVLTEIGHGRSNKQIARHLGISLGTTKTHVSHILEKLGIDSRTQAALVARDAGLLS
ncbi:response regulator [Enteractinococcus helveticum]|uniref:DNA-binding response regulator n=1 Tax=Enteractinococcus helveticum TaxID=1837282 RepID=A0A1B7LXN8_9MICC|nr:response regulator transcription factor [Enteractinococcus helveticum]OAV59946.1 DNA-binding response regulator [Enteractinococcus helveticum]